jgi:hypothetical protein
MKTPKYHIKSGNSFYEEKTEECIIPVGQHADYWSKYPLPVFGMVYVPAKGAAYWVDIKNYIRYNRAVSSIRFRCTKANVLSLDSFKRIFLPKITGTLPDEFPFDEALESRFRKAAGRASGTCQATV